MPYVALEHIESWTGRVSLHFAESAESQLKRFESGDILFGKLRPYLAKVARANCRGKCVGEFLVLRATNWISEHFLEHLLRSKPFIDWINSSTFGARMPRADWQFVGSTKLAAPPLAEQTAIARFLDHMDGRIQKYIRAKERLIALLDEYKQALIHQAVTGQIDVRTGEPYPEYKPSGDEWPGTIPSHWDVMRLGKVINLTVGFPFKSEGFSHADEDIRLLRGINVAPGQLRWDDAVRWPASDIARFAEFQLSAGDIILGMDRPIIGSGVRVAMVNESDVPSLLLQRVARIRPIEGKLTCEFAIRLLSGSSFSDYLAPIFTGISVPHLSPEQIRGFRVALPSLADQEAIGEYLDSIADRITRAVSRARAQIALLREYRTCLIADVVTGKLDVREAAPELPGTNAIGREEDGVDTIQAESHSHRAGHSIAEEANA